MSKAKLFQKMVQVMNTVGQIQKDGDIKDNQGKKMYSYLSEEATTAALQKAFVNHGLVMYPIKVDSEIIYLESMKYDKEVKTPITKVIVTYELSDTETGESIQLQSIGYGSDSQDKGSNKAMTGAFKYVQRQTFMISTGDDGDHVGNDELEKRQEKQFVTVPASSQTPASTNTGVVKPVSPAQIGMIKKLVAEKGGTVDQLLGKLNVTNLDNLTSSQASTVIKKLQEQG